MPRALTEEERARVRQRLQEKGEVRFLRMGLVKATISELAKDAGIGKGSFYSFYDSKEALFLDISAKREEAFQQELAQRLGKLTTGREALRELLNAPAEKLGKHPFLKQLLEPTVVAALLVKIPSSVLMEAQDKDRLFFTSLIQDWKERGWLRNDVKPEAVFSTLAAMFVLALHQEAIGEDTSTTARTVMVEALCDRWVRHD